MDQFTFSMPTSGPDPTTPSTSAGPGFPTPSLPVFSALSKMIRDRPVGSTGVPIAPKPQSSIRPPQSESTEDIFNKKASTAQERYRLLEAKDKLLRQKNPKTKVRVELAVKLVGSCPDMCPEKERYMRDFQRQLTPYETAPDGQVDHNLAIKAYTRSSADQEEPLPHELRPGSTLDMTLDYILHNIIPKGDSEDEGLDDWYTFVWDRTRAIRKDITQQELCDLNAVALMEKCARFHIHCASRLCELDRHSFDPKLNDENLMKCLQSLEHMYSDLRIKGVTCPNEPEFTAYKILLHLQEGDTLWEVQQRPISILKSPEVQLALRVHLQIFQKNFVGFFKLVEEASYMTSCILHRYFFQLRSQALRTLLWSSTKKDGMTAVPLPVAVKMLGFDNKSLTLLRILCQEHGIYVDLEKQRLLFSRKKFIIPDSPLTMRELYLVDSKLTVPVNEAINGGPLRELKPHVPQNSFNEEGFLIGINEKDSIAESALVVIQPIKLPEPELPKEAPLRIQTSLKFKPTIQREIKTMKPFVPSAFLKDMTKNESIKSEMTRRTPIVNTPKIFDMSQKVAEEREELARQLKKEKMKETIHQISLFFLNKVTDGVLARDLTNIGRIAWKEAEEHRNRIQVEKRKRAIIHLLSTQVSERIQDVVVENLSRPIAASSIAQMKIVEKVATQAAEKLISIHLYHSIPNICQEAMRAKKFERAEQYEAFKKSLQKAHLRYWFDTWRENIKELKEEKMKRAVERANLLYNMPICDITKTDKEVYDSWVLNLPLKRKIDTPDPPCQEKRILRDAKAEENDRRRMQEMSDQLMMRRLVEGRKARLEERRIREAEEALDIKQLQTQCEDLRELIKEEKCRYDLPF